jgi:hypothetical protein
MIIRMRPSEQVSGDISEDIDANSAAPRAPDRSISLGALRLHAQGLLASFEAGDAGFVPDTYLASFGDDATPAVLELCLCGVWVRAGDGYRVVSSEALRMAFEVHRQMRESRTQDG